jgi:hypothetical protein
LTFELRQWNDILRQPNSTKSARLIWMWPWMNAHHKQSNLTHSHQDRVIYIRMLLINRIPRDNEKRIMYVSWTESLALFPSHMKQLKRYNLIKLFILHLHFQQQSSKQTSSTQSKSFVHRLFTHLLPHPALHIAVGDGREYRNKITYTLTDQWQPSELARKDVNEVLQMRRCLWGGCIELLFSLFLIIPLHRFVIMFTNGALNTRNCHVNVGMKSPHASLAPTKWWWSWCLSMSVIRRS